MKKETIAIGKDFQGDEYILCWLPAKYEFASWFIGFEKAHYHGRYFKNFRDAVDDFERRACLEEEGSKIDWKIPSIWNEAQVALYFELKKD